MHAPGNVEKAMYGCSNETPSLVCTFLSRPANPNNARMLAFLFVSMGFACTSSGKCKTGANADCSCVGYNATASIDGIATQCVNGTSFACVTRSQY
jgi:hypothetical protein